MRLRTRNIARAWVLAASVGLGVLAVVGFAIGSPGEGQPITMPWTVIDSGGSTFSSGEVYRLGSSVAQPNANTPLTGDNYSLAPGFWAGATADITGNPPGQIDIPADAQQFSLIGSGGITESTGGEFTLSGSVAQSIAGPASGGDFTHNAGFMAAFEGDPPDPNAPVCNKRWVGPGTRSLDGDWSQASNWEPAGVPDISHDVCILTPGDYTVTATGGTANSVTVGDPQSLGSPTLWLAVGGGSTTFNAAGGLTNYGKVMMKGLDNNFLTLTSGGSPIVNYGTFSTEFGVAGARFGLGTSFVNHGQVVVGERITFNESVTNEDGQFRISPGITATATSSDRPINQNGGSFLVDGTLNVKTFNMNGGLLDVPGTMTSGFFFSNGGTVSGTVTLPSAVLSFDDTPASGDATFVMSSGLLCFNRICTESDGDGVLPAGQTLVIQSGGGTATTFAENGFTNRGRIVLTGTANHHSGFTLKNDGILVNRGIMDIEEGSTASGSRALTANVVNHGTINVNAPLTLAKENGRFTNVAGSLNVPIGERIQLFAAGHTFNMNGGQLNVDGHFDSDEAFNMNGGTLTVNSPFEVTSSVFESNGGVINGTLDLSGSDLSFGPSPATGTATFVLQGSGTLHGVIPQGQEVILQSVGGFAQFSAPDGLTNDGRLEIGGTANHSTSLTITGGTLLNNGTLDLTPGSSASAGRTINGDVDNHGIVNVRAPLSLANPDGLFTNTGEFNVPVGGVVTSNAAGFAFNHNDGSMNVDGSFDTDETFVVNGGVLNIDGLLKGRSATIEWHGGKIHGTFDLDSSTLALDAPSASGTAEFLMTGGGILSGAVPPGQEIVLRSTGGFAPFTAPGGLTNNGRMEISGTGGHSTTLTITGDTLVNYGVIDVNPGVPANAARALTGELHNHGEFNVNAPISIGSAGATHENSGVVNVLGADLTWNLIGQDSMLLSTGEFHIGEGRILQLNGGLGGGWFTSLAPAMFTGPSELKTNSTIMNMSGNVEGEITLVASTMNLGGSIGELSVGGDYTHSGTSNLNVELAPDAVDVLNVGGTASFFGRNLNVSMIDGAAPGPCHQFPFMTYGTLNAYNLTDNGLDLGDGMMLRRVDTGTGMSLVAYDQNSSVNIHPTDIEVAEGGGLVDYNVCLSQQPTADVQVTATPDDQMAVKPSIANFSPTDWELPKTLRASAIFDGIFEGTHAGVIAHEASSDDPSFAGKQARLDSTIYENNVFVQNLDVVTDTDTVIFNAEVCDTGLSIGPLEVAVWTDRVAAPTVDDKDANATTVVSIPAEGCVPVSILAFGVPDGLFTGWMLADSAANVFEQDEANNAASQRYAVGSSGADMFPEMFNVGHEAGSTMFNLTVCNDGLHAGSFRVSIWSHRDEAPEAGDLDADAELLMFLNADECEDASVTAEALTDGAFTAWILADSTDGVDETDETNNVASSDYVVGPAQPRCGDSNLDGAITVIDVIIALKIIIGAVVPTPAQLFWADLDQDGDITTIDAIPVLQAIVGMISLPDTCGLTPS